MYTDPVHCHQGKFERCRRSNCCRCCESYFGHSPRSLGFRDIGGNLPRYHRYKSKARTQVPQQRPGRYNLCYWASVRGYNWVQDSGLVSGMVLAWAEGRLHKRPWQSSGTSRGLDFLVRNILSNHKLAQNKILPDHPIGDGGSVLVRTIHTGMLYMVYEGSAVCSGTTIIGFWIGIERGDPQKVRP